MIIHSRLEWSDGELNPVRSMPSTIHDVTEVHHSAGPVSSDPVRTRQLIRSYYYVHTVNNGWSDLFYHFVVDSTGAIYEGRAVGRRSSDNPSALTVMVLGNYDYAIPTEAAKNAILDLNEHFGFDTKTIDWHRARADRLGKHYSACPGKHMIQWLQTNPTKEPMSIPQSTAEYHVNWCYDKILGRKADEGGFKYWTDRLVAGKTTIPDMRWEFQAVKNGMLSVGASPGSSKEEQFVRDLIDLAKDA